MQKVAGCLFKNCKEIAGCSDSIEQCKVVLVELLLVTVKFATKAKQINKANKCINFNG